jgi:hypothetical protein
MGFSEVDACSSTLAVARFKQYKRRILTTKKHAQNKSIAVLKNTAQNGRYMLPIQSFIENYIFLSFASKVLHGRPWVGRVACSSRSHQGNSHPRLVTMKVTPTDHPASCLSSWLNLKPIRQIKEYALSHNELVAVCYATNSL